MTWEIRLINIYCTICDYGPELGAHCMRHSNNFNPSFTDNEVMTIYLYCTAGPLKLRTKRSIYAYADMHLRTWFPKLPGYAAFNARTNALGESFRALSERLAELAYQGTPASQAGIGEIVVDSAPVMLAKNQRAKTAKVATEIANLGYCATKGIAYHGFKLHVAGLVADGARLPAPYCIIPSAASTHDGRFFRESIAPNCPNTKIYADSAYVDAAAAPELLQLYNVTVCPIQKRKRGQPELHYDQKCQNTAISRIRQPIEGYFNWLIEHTGIQDASKCRSTKGALVHLYGKIAASLLLSVVFNS